MFNPTPNLNSQKWKISKKFEINAIEAAINYSSYPPSFTDVQDVTVKFTKGNVFRTRFDMWKESNKASINYNKRCIIIECRNLYYKIAIDDIPNDGVYEKLTPRKFFVLKNASGEFLKDYKIPKYGITKDTFKFTNKLENAYEFSNYKTIENFIATISNRYRYVHKMDNFMRYIDKEYSFEIEKYDEDGVLRNAMYSYDYYFEKNYRSAYSERNHSKELAETIERIIHAKNNDDSWFNEHIFLIYTHVVPFAQMIHLMDELRNSIQFLEIPENNFNILTDYTSFISVALKEYDDLIKLRFSTNSITDRNDYIYARDHIKSFIKYWDFMELI